MGKSMISARIPDELDAKLEGLAAATQRSKAFLLTEALEDYVARQSWQMRKIDAAFKEADESGEWISEAAMEEWVLSLGTDAELPPPQPDVFKTPKLKP